jgi:hypothetical protein
MTYLHRLTGPNTTGAIGVRSGKVLEFAVDGKPDANYPKHNAETAPTREKFDHSDGETRTVEWNYRIWNVSDGYYRVCQPVEDFDPKKWSEETAIIVRNGEVKRVSLNAIRGLLGMPEKVKGSSKTAKTYVSAESAVGV